MHTATITVVFLLVLGHPGLGLYTNTTSSLQNLPSSVKELLDTLCPSVDICNANDTNAEISLNGWLTENLVSCCTGCSCHPDCKKTRNCCFPDNSDVSVEKSTPRYQCRHSAIGNPDENLPISVESYLMVVEEPSNGCISKEPFSVDHGLILHPSCEDTLGEYSLFPVYSKSTAEIYKNIQCARCHGVLDTQSTIPVLIYGTNRRIKVNSFSEILNVFDRLPPRCHIEFRYDSPRQVSGKRCFHDVISTCETNRIKYYKGVDMQDIHLDLIQNLCEYSVYSPFPARGGVYRNVFCLLCSRTMPGPLTLSCEYGSIERSDSSAFTSLIKPDVYLGQQFVSRKVYPKICLDDDGSKDGDGCYKVYCPTGRIRNNHGHCVFMSNHWMTSPFKVCLKLIPLQHEDYRVNLRQMEKGQLKDVIMKSSPWPKEWKLWQLFVRYDDSVCEDRSNVFVELITKRGYPSEFVAQITESSGLLWTFEMNGQPGVFRQSLCEFELRNYSSSRKLHVPRMAEFEDKMHGCESTILKLIASPSIVFTESPLTISKLFFCQQIQLNSTEFLLATDKSQLLSNLTWRVLYKFEFELIRNEEGYQARLCKEDTILQYHQNKGARHGIIMLAMLSVLFR